MSAVGPAPVQCFDVHDFTFHDGTRVSDTRLAYTDINSSAFKVALIITCFSGRIPTTLTFTSGALRDYRIIIVALFGNGESSSPSNTSNFPKSLDYRDCVHAQRALLTQKLNINSLDLVLGFSMGGQCTYYWTAMFPEFIKNAVIICSSARTSRHNYQFLEGPKAALLNSIDYGNERNRNPTADGKTSCGLQAFGKACSAWLTSAEWFEQGLWKDMGCSSLEEWDAQITEVGFQGWDADDLLSKLRMWQHGDITVCSPGGKDSLEDALARIKTRILLLPCQTDQYFHPEANEKEAKHLANAEVDIIPSIWGHIAGGGANPRDVEWMDQRISRFLSEN